MSLESLPGVRDMADAHGLLARKSLGQHFLYDLNVTRKIVRLAGALAGVSVMEVGPGPGGLTRALLESEAERVVAVETDDRFLPLLREIGAASGGKLEILHGDALKVDPRKALGGGPRAIVANLPYNVGTPMLVNWLAAEPVAAQSMTLMFQKEVALRIAAGPGTKDYGRLAVLAQSRSDVRLEMTVPARAFTPPPKIDSAVVRLDMREDRFMDVAALETVARAAFTQRRKMLRKSLGPLGDVDALLEAADIAPEARPETVPVAAFQEMARAWRALNPAREALL